MIRKIAFTLGLLLLTPVLVLPGWIALNRTDLPSPDDADLELDLAELADESNGFARLAAAARAVDMPDGNATWERLRAFRAGETWEPDWISELVRRNERATALLRSALAAPVLQFPAVDYSGDAITQRTDLLLEIQQLLRVAGAQSRMKLRSGHTGEALELATLGTRVARAVSTAKNIDLVDLLMAGSYQSISLWDLECIVRAAPISRAAAYELNELLESSRWNARSWHDVWAFEYQFLKAAFARAADSDDDEPEFTQMFGLPAWGTRLIPTDYLWQPNRTLSLLAEFYRDQAEKSERFCADAGLVLDDHFGPEETAALPTLLLPNGVGRLIIQISRPNFDRFQLRRCHFETRVSLAQALIAAKAYWHEEARLPEDVNDLVPRYLSELPLDHYDGAPIRYSRSRKLIYSIGDDFEDAGGNDETDASDRAEPTLSLAF